MKIIMLAILLSFLGLDANAQILGEIGCRVLGKENNYNVPNRVNLACAKADPAFVLHELFEKSFPNISFRRTELPSDELVITQFGVKDYAFYVKKGKDGRIEFIQGLENSECHYKYKVTTEGRSQKKYCEAEVPKKASAQCLKMRALDPIGNHVSGKKDRSCNVFLEAMTSCMNEKKDCRTALYKHMNKKDNEANPYNKPTPASSDGLSNKGTGSR